MTNDEIMARIAAAIEAQTAREVFEALEVAVPALAAAEVAANAATAAATDPGVSAAEARTRRQMAEDAAHEAKRLNLAVEKLKARELEWLDLAQANARRKLYDATREWRDGMAERIKHEAPALIENLRQLLAELVDLDRMCAKVNRDLPPGAEPLNGAEGVARDFVDMGDGLTGQTTETVRLAQIVLPDLRTRDGVAWPPRALFWRDLRNMGRLMPMAQVRTMAAKGEAE